MQSLLHAPRLALHRLAIILTTSFAIGSSIAAPAVPSVGVAASAVTGALVEPGVQSLDKASVTSSIEAAAPPDNAFASRFRDKAADMVSTAMNFLGVPYRRGGQSAESGFDCSGLTRQVFESSLGLVLPHRADQQAKAPGLIAIMREQLQPGDLVFFNTLRRTFSHVGIYLGDGKFIHAPRAGAEVRVEDMGIVYWAKRFTGARRAEPLAEAAAAMVGPDAALAAPLPPTASLQAPAIR